MDTVHVEVDGSRAQSLMDANPWTCAGESDWMTRSSTCQVESAAAEVKEREAELRRREEELRAAQADLHTRSQLLQARRGIASRYPCTAVASHYRLDYTPTDT
jgi:hypothetical protein